MLVRGKDPVRQIVIMYCVTGTGDVLKIQSLLHICSEHYGTSETDEKSEPAATTGGSGSATSGSLW